jgi:hypothetical protein
MPFEYVPDHVTRDQVEGLLRNLRDDLLEFPTDENLREDGIPDPLVAQMGRIREAVQVAMNLIREGDTHDDHPTPRLPGL